MTMHDTLVPMLGNVTARNVAQTLPRAMESGDVHIAVYDYTPGDAALLIALGSTSGNFSYRGVGGRPAWAAPFVRFGAKQLWEEPAPSVAAR